MEQRYKAALEIILAMVENAGYVREADIKIICETALKESEDKTDE